MVVQRCGNLSLLPSHVIEAEILTRLAVKSVMRFKSVCKSWNLFISNNPDFIKSHLHLNPNNDSLILKGIGGDRIKRFHDQESLLQGDTRIIGSVNGLVCFYNWHYKFEGIQIAIWNPGMKQCLTNIPILHCSVDRELECNDCFGFGFDSASEDFKVMHVITNEGQPLVGEIYSCNRRCWRKITPSKFLFKGYVPSFIMPVTLRGSPCWLSILPNGEDSRLTVISFDVRNEVFKMLPEAGSMNEKQKGGILMNFRDSIAIMVYDWKHVLTEAIDVYVFNERCSNWNRMSVGPVMGKELNIWFSLQLLSQCFKNEDISFLKNDGEVCCVNLQTHAIKSLQMDRKLNFIVYGCTYSESLVLIDGMKHFDEKEDQVGIFFLKKA